MHLNCSFIQIEKGSYQALVVNVFKAIESKESPNAKKPTYIQGLYNTFDVNLKEISKDVHTLQNQNLNGKQFCGDKNQDNEIGKTCDNFP